MTSQHPVSDPVTIEELQPFLESKIVPGGRKIKAILSFVGEQAPGGRADFIRSHLETAQSQGRNFSFQYGRNQEFQLTWFCGDAGGYILSYDDGRVRVSNRANIASLTDTLIKDASVWETVAD